MTTEELMAKVDEKIGSSILPDETLIAIQNLFKERNEAIDALKAKDEEFLSLRTKLAAKDAEISIIEFAKTKAEVAAKESSWLANELGKFVRDIANGLYEGKEIAAARRVYDLNSGSLSKKRINASNYDSGFDAELAFRKEHGYTSNEEYTYAEFMAWCWTQAKN